MRASAQGLCARTLRVACAACSSERRDAVLCADVVDVIARSSLASGREEVDGGLKALAWLADK